MVGTSSMAHGVGRRVEGGLNVSIRFPGWRSGRSAAAPRSRHARDWLALMGCARRQGTVYRFAQIVAAHGACARRIVGRRLAMATGRGRRTSSGRTTDRGGLRCDGTWPERSADCARRGARVLLPVAHAPRATDWTARFEPPDRLPPSGPARTAAIASGVVAALRVQWPGRPRRAPAPGEGSFRVGEQTGIRAACRDVETPGPLPRGRPLWSRARPTTTFVEAERIAERRDGIHWRERRLVVTRASARSVCRRGQAGDGTWGRAGRRVASQDRDALIPAAPRPRSCCSGCGDPSGLRMPLPTEEGARRATRRTSASAERHQGGPGIVHGGIVAAALDEARRPPRDVVPVPDRDGADLRPLPPRPCRSTPSSSRAHVGRVSARPADPRRGRAPATTTRCSPRRARRSSTSRSSTSWRRREGRAAGRTLARAPRLALAVRARDGGGEAEADEEAAGDPALERQVRGGATPHRAPGDRAPRRCR